MAQISKFSTGVIGVVAVAWAIAGSAPLQADTLSRSQGNPHFTVDTPGATVTFNWFSPVPATIVLERYNGGYNSNPRSSIVYEGPPPASLSLTGGGRTGGGRYTIKAKNAAGNFTSFRVTVAGPKTVKNW